MVGGQLRPDSGRVMLGGQEITGRPPREICHLGVGRTFQVAQTFLSMTVLGNVQMALIAHHRRTRDMVSRAEDMFRAEAAALLARVGMADAAERPIGELAYGDVKRVELAIALAAAPRLLLMDEPTAGMAPRERAELMALVAGIARGTGIGVLFTEHDMDAVFAHADRILVLVRGEVIAEGPPEAVRANEQVQRVYLGTTGHKAALRARRRAHA
jgi:branched-chain amino acid transport system ATP-binding protein